MRARQEQLKRKARPSCSREETAASDQGGSGSLIPHLVWAVGSLCALNRVPFDAEILLKQFPPPYTTDEVVRINGERVTVLSEERAGKPASERP